MIDIEQIKDTLADHEYQYKQTIAANDYSAILQCHSLKNNFDFAIKRTDKDQISREEYKTLVSLHHPHIVKIYDAFEDEFGQYIVMQYCPNGTIKQKGKLNYDQFIFYAKQLLDALAYCHSNNIAHRNIKPENILLDQYENAKLADFIIAKKFQNAKTNEKYGSKHFFAPEMFLNDDFCPFKADVWALGITFFCMATGSYPFHGISKIDLKQNILIGELNFAKYNVDKRIRSLILKMVQVNPDLRESPEKLLNSSIFSQLTKGNIPNSLSDRKTHITTAKSMDFLTEKKTSSSNDSQNSDCQTSLNTCKCINLFTAAPMIDRHLQPYKPKKK